jgi:hypothetical protein
VIAEVTGGRLELPDLLRSDTDGRLFRIAGGIQERAAERPALSELVQTISVHELGADSRSAANATLTLRSRAGRCLLIAKQARQVAECRYPRAMRSSRGRELVDERLASLCATLGVVRGASSRARNVGEAGVRSGLLHGSAKRRSHASAATSTSSRVGYSSNLESPLRGDGMSGVLLIPLAVATGVVVIVVAVAVVLVVLFVTLSMRGGQRRGAKRRGETRQELADARAERPERDRDIAQEQAQQRIDPDR